MKRQSAVWVGTFFVCPLAGCATTSATTGTTSYHPKVASCHVVLEDTLSHVVERKKGKR